MVRHSLPRSPLNQRPGFLLCAWAALALHPPSRSIGAEAVLSAGVIEGGKGALIRGGTRRGDESRCAILGSSLPMRQCVLWCSNEQGRPQKFVLRGQTCSMKGERVNANVTLHHVRPKRCISQEYVYCLVQ